jgi:ABC-2 type transport system ATP-binding protein
MLAGVRLRADIRPAKIIPSAVVATSAHSYRRPMITIDSVSKRYGDQPAVEELSFEVMAGRVTGFLGPNGSGKSTTMRMIVGLDAPSAGRVLVNGRRYAEIETPMQEVGALLEAGGAHPGRSGRAHLRALAATHGIGRRRVEEALEMVGLAESADRRAGEFSLGMSQRLGIGAALLGDPGVVLLDEPVNGLDPDGVRWIRGLLRGLAAEGRTVFVSSHLMNEMAITADHLIVIGRGRLIADASIETLTKAPSQPSVRVRTPEAARLAEVLAAPDVAITRTGAELLKVEGVAAERIGRLVQHHRLAIYEMTPVQLSLEDAFVELTRGALEFDAGRPGR